MLNKLEVVKYLIQEIEEEKELFKIYEADIKQAKYEANKVKGTYWGNYLRHEGRQPSKSRIKDNCKKIRQILLDVSKEIVRRQYND